MKYRKSLNLAQDDLEVGMLIAVVSIKGSDLFLPFSGLAAKMRAINLPFVVVQPVGQPDTITLDLRYFNIMEVSAEFAEAQKPTFCPRPDSFQDVRVIPVALLDEENALRFNKAWLIQHANGSILEFDTEEEALAYQRSHRIRHGRNPLTGEPTNSSLWKSSWHW